MNEHQRNAIENVMKRATPVPRKLFWQEESDLGDVWLGLSVNL